MATLLLLSPLVPVLAPVVPHVTHVLWAALDRGPLLDAPLPQPDAGALARDSLTLAVQVNGKLRAQIEVAADADRLTIETAALADAQVQRFLEGRPAKKVIVVPGKLVNVVG